MREPHLDGVGDRADGLSLEGVGTAVPDTGELRPPFWPPMPTPVGVCAVYPVAGSWQLAQLTVESAESRVSKYNCRPSSIFARVSGFVSSPWIWDFPCASPSGSSGWMTTWFRGSASQASTSASVTTWPAPGMPAVSAGSPSTTNSSGVASAAGGAGTGLGGFSAPLVVDAVGAASAVFCSAAVAGAAGGSVGSRSISSISTTASPVCVRLPLQPPVVVSTSKAVATRHAGVTRATALRPWEDRAKTSSDMGFPPKRLEKPDDPTAGQTTLV